jgi:hypothetical protein
LSSGIRRKRNGIGKILFTFLIIVTALVSSAFTYAAVQYSKIPTEAKVGDSSFISSIADIFPTSRSNSTTGANTTANCYTGNWSTIYEKYESPSSGQQNSTALGQQYLSDPQFMSFLSQYLNMSDPQVNATVYGLLSGNETMFVQQQLQSQVC